MPKRQPCAGHRAGASWANLNWKKSPSASLAGRRATRNTPPRNCTASCDGHPHALRTSARSIARLVDGSELDEFKHLYGTTIVIGFARIWGYRSVSSPTTASCSTNRAEGGALHRACVRSARHSVAVPAENITGFMVAGRSTRRAASRATAPSGDRRLDRERAEVHVIVGGSYGAGNYGMCGRATARVPVDVAVGAHLGDGRRTGGQRLATVRRDNIEGKGGTLAKDEERSSSSRSARPTSARSSYYATARLWDDGISIRSTRA